MSVELGVSSANATPTCREPGVAYVTAEGKAEIRDSDIWDDTRKILVKYRGEEGGAAYLERLKKQPRVLVVFTPTRLETLGLAD